MKINKIKTSSTIILKNKSIKHAMKILNFSRFKTLLVVENLKEKKLIGSITDGDIRRALINGFKLENKVEKISFKNCFYIMNFKEIYKNIKKLKEYSIEIVPLVNKQKKIIGIFHIERKDKDIDKKQVLNIKKNPILLMAGGKGSRLGELTKKKPKPILTIEKISIIERILNQLIDQGYNNIYISIHYLASKVKKHLNKYKNKIKIKYIEEKKPLGTIGSFKNIETKNKYPVILIYSDIFTNFDVDKILNFHIKTNSKITIIGKKHYIQNPYGVLNVNKKGKLLKISEKPKTETLISTGIFIINHDLQKFIKKNTKTEMDFFLNKMLEKKMRVSVFNQDDYWYDLGNKVKFQNFKTFFDD